MKRQKKIIPFIAVSLGVCFMGAIVYFGIDVVQYYSAVSTMASYTDSTADSLTSLNLTKEQKLEDFDDYFNVITTSNPMVNEYPELYGVSFVDEYDRYRCLVEDTDNDFEFYCTMSAIANDLPSCHNFVFFPDFEDMTNYGSYNHNFALSQKGLEETTYYWHDLIEDECNNDNSDQLIFSYYAGNYIESMSSTYDTGYDTLLLTAVDGKPVDDYILSNLSCTGLKYDFEKQTPYRYSIFFNDDTGTPVELTAQTRTGDIIKLNMYADLYSEYRFICQYNLDDEVKDDCPQDHYSIENQGSVLIIEVYDMSNDFGEDLSNDIRKSLTSRIKSVIIDLRENGGGSTWYAGAYIYPDIFTRTVSRSDTFYMIASENNKEFYSNTVNKLIYGLKKLNKDVDFLPDRNYVYGTDDCDFVGYSNKPRDVYVLTSDGTASASDYFVSVLKDSDSATIVGTNTAGEGLMYMLFMDSMKNSKLVYLYNAEKTVNADGTDNSLYGTAPDVYTDYTVDDIMCRNDIAINGQDPYSYENRLKWDRYLITTLDLIANKKY